MSLRDPDLDDRLRSLFERLRQAEEEHVPPLTRVLGCAPGRLRLIPTWALARRIAAVAAVVSLAALAAWWSTPARQPERQVASADMALLYWSSPTAGLLTAQEDYVAVASQPSAAAEGRGKAEEE
jgi:hypothetical protein